MKSGNKYLDWVWVSKSKTQAGITCSKLAIETVD